MGDRGNVYITNTATEGYTAPEFLAGARGIYVYSHWDGSELPTMVRDALKAGKGRWGDDEYLTRIIIDQITKSGRDQETGYGVGLTMLDNSYPITIVDLGAQRVAWASPGSERAPANWKHVTGFAAFVSPDWTIAGYPPGLR